MTKPQTTESTLEERIAGRVDRQVTGELAVRGTGGAMSLVPRNMNEVMEFAKVMSTAGIAIPKGFRANPGMCLAVTIQALRWGMDPFAVANKAYVVPTKDGDQKLAFEAQLFHAVVNERAPLQKRLEITYDGTDIARTCTVKGLLEGEELPKVYTTPPVANIQVKNSPLWKGDVDQQLSYYAIRAWARKWVPEVVLGVYTQDEIAEEGHYGPDRAKDITPRPRQDDYKDEPVDFEVFNQFGEVMHTYGPRGFADSMIEMLHHLKTAKLPRSVFDTFVENNKANVRRLYDVHKDAFANDIAEAIILTGATFPTDVVDPEITEAKEPESKASGDTPSQAQNPVQGEPQVANGASKPGTTSPLSSGPGNAPQKDQILWVGTDGQTAAFGSIIDLKAHIKKGVAKKGTTAAQLQAMLTDNEKTLKILRAEGGPSAAVCDDIVALLENAIKVRNE